MAENGAFPSQRAQGERVLGFLAGLVEAAAAPKGIFFETNINQEIGITVALPAGSLHKTPTAVGGGPREVIRKGEVVERLMALGCKPSVLRDYGGSNPPLSTRILGSGRE